MCLLRASRHPEAKFYAIPLLYKSTQHIIYEVVRIY
jgi:hypothetical protein